MATTFVQLSVQTFCFLHTGHLRTSGSGVGATLGFHQSPRSFLKLYGIFTLWRRCFPLDFTGALFCTFAYSWWVVFCLNFVAFFHVFGLLFWCTTSSGAYGHSVFNTFVQLTEGRSARDLPKQPPAKKNHWLHVAEDVHLLSGPVGLFCLCGVGGGLLCCCFCFCFPLLDPSLSILGSFQISSIGCKDWH